MNICIDHGNSRAKVALFAEDGRIVKTFVYKSFTAADVERVFALYPINDSIISSVVNLEPAMVNSLHRLSKRFVLLDHKTPLPIVNDYDTPATLGQDRLAAAVGAAELFPNENVLIIDDLMKGGGTAHGMVKLAEELGANVVGKAFLIESVEPTKKIISNYTALLRLYKIDEVNNKIDIRPI